MAETNVAGYSRILRFLITGAVNTGFGYISYIGFVLTGMPLWLAIVGSMIAAFFFNFVTYGAVVFKDLSYRNLPRFLLFYVFVAVLNYTALQLLALMGIKPLVGQAVLLPVLGSVCYLGLKGFVFRPTQNAVK